MRSRDHLIEVRLNRHIEQIVGLHVGLGDGEKYDVVCDMSQTADSRNQLADAIPPSEDGAWVHGLVLHMNTLYT